MTDNYADIVKYSFSYTDCTGKTHTKEIRTEDVTWPECLNDFVRFLESVYEYDIMSKVRIQESKLYNTFYAEYPGYLDPWTGSYFSDEEEQDKNKETTHFKWDE